MIMATGGLSFVKKPAAAAAAKAAREVQVQVEMSGGDKWDTGTGSKNRSFNIKLKG